MTKIILIYFFNARRCFSLKVIMHGNGGSRIRTHGRFTIAGFQDQCLNPLGHSTKIYNILTYKYVI